MRELAGEHAPGRHTTPRLPPCPFEIVADGLRELADGVSDDDEQAEFAERDALLREERAALGEKPHDRYYEHGAGHDADPSNIPEAQRRAIVREVYAEVLAAGKAARIDTFSGSYGLMRGLAAAFVVILVLAIVAGKGAAILGTLVVLFLLALHRMHRYSQHCATELFIQFLALKRKKAEPTG